MSSNGSNHDHGEHDAPHGQQAEDQIDYFKVVGVGVVSLIIFAVATWWASIILRRETTRVEQESGATRVPAEIHKQEIGIVDQVPFVADHRLELWRKERAERLDGYGWVDRTQGIAHIPIEKAMEQVAAGALPAGAPK